MTDTKPFSEMVGKIMQLECEKALMVGYILGLWFKHNPGKNLRDFVSENQTIVQIIGPERFDLSEKKASTQ